MPHNIVLLNLADTAAGGGLVGKVARSLKQKYPVTRSGLRAANQITECTLFQLLDGEKAGGLLRADPELMKVRALCMGASKIMLCMHGLHNDVNSGFANDTLDHKPMAAVATAEQLARFVLALLPAREPEYHVALVMCYGARSSNFRLDHQGQLAPAELKTSFAYKFYRGVCIARNVYMTARTGATSFDQETGRSMVESEASVQARADKEDYLRDTTTDAAIQAYKTLKDSYTRAAHGGSEARARQWMAMEAKFRSDADAVAASADEGVLRAYFQVLKQKKLYEAAMEGQDRSKYGKHTYRYAAATKEITIRAKYPAPGGVLYQGPLL